MVLFGQIDQDDIRVFARSVEHDGGAIVRNIKRPESALVAETSELARFLCGEIEEPEIERLIARQIHEARSVR